MSQRKRRVQKPPQAEMELETEMPKKKTKKKAKKKPYFKPGQEPWNTSGSGGAPGFSVKKKGKKKRY